MEKSVVIGGVTKKLTGKLVDPKEEKTLENSLSMWSRIFPHNFFISYFQ